MSRTFIDTWKVKAVSHLNTKFDLEDEEGESTLVEISESEKYLGDILTADGKNRKNILPRAGKGVGIRKQIMSMLEDVCFGPFFFEVTLMYRTSLFLNNILLNSEAWYSPPIKDIEELEKVDSSILRGILEAPRGTPNCTLYLELGCIPIRFLIMQRRLIFLHSLLQEEGESLLFKVLNSQIEEPIRQDMTG